MVWHRNWRIEELFQKVAVNTKKKKLLENWTFIIFISNCYPWRDISDAKNFRCDHLTFIIWKELIALHGLNGK